MILEGLVTTRDADGSPHLAPMGPAVEPSMRSLVLRPFPTSHTCRNLLERPEGVFHVTDDVLLLARAALSAADPPPALRPAREVAGWVVADACRSYEFRVTAVDTSTERVRMECEVVRADRHRDFLGFNRARHAVLEAAILATRTDFLPLDEVAVEFRKLAVLVDKTGGPAEHEAFAFLQAHLDRARAARGTP
jgi:hypothetical protein